MKKKIKVGILTLLAGALATCGVSSPASASDTLKTYDIERDRFITLYPDQGDVCLDGWYMATKHTSENARRIPGCWTIADKATIIVRFENDSDAIYDKLMFFPDRFSTTRFR